MKIETVEQWANRRCAPIYKKIIMCGNADQARDLSNRLMPELIVHKTPAVGKSTSREKIYIEPNDAQLKSWSNK